MYFIIYLIIKEKSILFFFLDLCLVFLINFILVGSFWCFVNFDRMLDIFFICF